MPGEQILMGVVIAAGCAAGIPQVEWILSRTKLGGLLIRLVGSDRGPLALRVILVLGVLFGIFLATGVIHPVRWN